MCSDHTESSALDIPLQPYRSDLPWIVER